MYLLIFKGPTKKKKKRIATKCLDSRDSEKIAMRR